MKAYVTLRGSRSYKAVTRDASPGGECFPYAGLVIGHSDGDSTTFELQFDPHPDGSAVVTLYMKKPGGEAQAIARRKVSVS